MRTYFISLIILSLAFPIIAQAQTVLRYEGQISGPGITGTQTGQQFRASLRRPDNCGASLGVTQWTSSSITIENGFFTITPSFDSTDFASAMDPDNNFSGACPSTPYTDRQLVVEWYNGSSWESFYVNISDAPRAAIALKSNEAKNAKAIGGVNVNPAMSCSAGQYLQYDSGNSRLTCSPIAAGDIPALGASIIQSGTLNPAQIPILIGDVSGSITATSVQKIQGVSVSSTAPTNGQSLIYNGSNWAPGAASATDNTKLPLTGGTMTGPIDMGANSITNTTNMSATNASIRNLVLNDLGSNQITLKTPSSVPGNYTLTLPGTTGANGQVLSTDGSGTLSWISPAAGSISSLGGQTGSTQTFAVNASGTAPAINSASNIHTLSIPLASGAGVTSGTISKTDYDTFTAKLTSPLTTKGDLLTRDASTHIRLPAGTNGQILSVNSATSSGLEWIPVPTGSGDITDVIAGNGLIGGAPAGSATLNIVGGNGIIVNSDDIAVDVGLGANKIPQVGSALGANGVVIANGTATALTSLNCALDQVIKFDASGFAGCAPDNSGPTNAFTNSGNSFGTSADFGTNDNFALNFRTNGTTRMTLDPNGNVGLGTTSPTANLSIEASDQSTFTQIVNTSSSASSRFPSVVVTNYTGSSAGYPKVSLQNSRGSKGSPFPLQMSNVIGKVEAQGYNNSAFTPTASIDFIASENYTSGATGSDIEFWVTKSGTTAITRAASIKNDGTMKIESSSVLQLSGKTTTQESSFTGTQDSGKIWYNTNQYRLKYYDGDGSVQVRTVATEEDNNNFMGSNNFTGYNFFGGTLETQGDLKVGGSGSPLQKIVKCDVSMSVPSIPANYSTIYQSTCPNIEAGMMAQCSIKNASEGATDQIIINGLHSISSNQVRVRFFNISNSSFPGSTIQLTCIAYRFGP